MSPCAHCGHETRCYVIGALSSYGCGTHACCPDCHWQLHEEPHRMRVELAPVPWDVHRQALQLDEMEAP